MTRLIRSLTHLLEYAAGATLIVMMLHVIADVVGRYFFNYPAPATTEIVAYYYMVAAVFGPLAFVELRDRSISVDLFYNWFSPVWKRITLGIGIVCAIAFFGGITVKSAFDAVDAYTKGEMIEGLYTVIIWPPRFGMPISFGLATVILCMRFVEEVILRHEPIGKDEEPPDHIIQEGID